MKLFWFIRKFFQLLSCLIMFLLAIRAVAEEKKVLSLLDVLRYAEDYSPNIKSSEKSIEVAHQNLRISQSYYFPNLNLTIVDSFGFPASVNPPVGFNGLMNSPYRVGLSGGIFSSVTLFDLTRKYNTEVAKLGIRAAQERKRLSRLHVDLKAMNLYLNAVLYKNQVETWKGIQSKVVHLYKLIKSYVRNGQYSEVTKWLLKNQIEEAQRQEENAKFAFEAALQQLKVEIGLQTVPIEVDNVSTLAEGLKVLTESRYSKSPLLEVPQLEAEIAHSFALRESALHWPRLFGTASVGFMENSRLISKESYAFWVGLSVPVFEGFRIDAEVARARAQAYRSEDLSRQAEYELVESNTSLQQEINSRLNDWKKYQVEKKYAQKALSLAEYRLNTFVGSLSDVRDALKSIEIAEIGSNIAQIELFRAKLTLSLIDGGFFISSSFSPFFSH